MGLIFQRLLLFALLWAGFGLQAQTTLPPRLSGIGGAGAVDIGQRVVLGPIFSGTVPSGGLTYQWRKNGVDLPGATASTFVIESVAASDAGTYGVSASNEAGTSVATGEVTVRPLAAIVFTTQPPNRTAQVGQPVVFGVVVTGTFPRSFQWRKDGVDIPSATTSVLTLPAVAISDAGSYSLAGTNPLGTTISSSASLTVNAATPVVFFANSPGDATFTHGGQGVLSAAVSMGSSPFTYQWRKDGVAIPGATNLEIRFATVVPADAGRYSVVVTNPAGPVTSREAVVTVLPATPVTISGHPLSVSVFEGQTASFNVNVTAGSQPITYQWMKNGAAIPGATFGSLGINRVALTDAGTYTAVITNAAGSVTSNGAVLTVTPAAPPVIAQQPVGGTIPFYDRLSLNALYTGTQPLTLEWKRDDRVVSTGRGDYSVSNATPTDSGVYVLMISNIAGSVATTPVTVIVNPPALPVITRQPIAVQVAAGMSASFRVEFNSVGTGPIGLQWLKNGRPIPGTDSGGFSPRPEYYINLVGPEDEGDYSVILTGAGGSVTSQAARLTVLTATPPTVSDWPVGTFTGLGQTVQFNVRSPGGSPPLRIQWFKEGVPIAGETSGTLYRTGVTESDLGLYSVTVSNAGGVIASPDFPLQLYASQSRPWLVAERWDNIVYFLATAPNRIERYDLAGERWLPSTPLSNPESPTALLPTAEGVYLAYGRRRRSRMPFSTSSRCS
jgi:hypothetical protein